MAIYRSGFCSHPECQGKKETLIVNRSRMLCVKHNAERLNKIKPEKKKPKAERKRSLPSGERDLFLIIWGERPHYCTNCCAYLGDEPRAQYFAHIIPKSRGEQYRLDKDNIRLLCFTCHRLYDQGTREQFVRRANRNIL